MSHRFSLFPIFWVDDFYGDNQDQSALVQGW